MDPPPGRALAGALLQVLNLRGMEVANNALMGRLLPSGIMHMQSLGLLIANGNRLAGSLPSSIYTAAIVIIELADNALSGTIPAPSWNLG